MSSTLQVRVREARERRGWTQQQLASRAGLSRAGISAIENGRLAPSTAAALALAAALQLRVEDLFSLAGEPKAAWAWTPSVWPARFWCARFADRILAYPVEPWVPGGPPHDGLATDEQLPIDADLAARTLVVAGCDPAAGLLVAQAARQAQLRVIALPRGSGEALRLLGQGVVHCAGVHLGRSNPDGNAASVRSSLGPAYSLLRIASWELGIVLAPGRRLSGVRGARRARLRWVGREPGSGARQCLDEILGKQQAPEHIARDHRGVVESIRMGFGDAGVCPRLVGEEARLRFLHVREEAFDLCAHDTLSDDWRLRALCDVIQSPAYRRLLGELPGYDAREAGALRQV